MAVAELVTEHDIIVEHVSREAGELRQGRRASFVRLLEATNAHQTDVT